MGGTVPTTPRVFIIARNPDPDSRLPYLLRLPLADAPILKARDTWPRTARVFCHRADEWPEDAELIEEVPVLGCVRRGVAIDLVLDRPRENPTPIGSRNSRRRPFAGRSQPAITASSGPMARRWPRSSARRWPTWPDR